jgi:hypothetical protein
VSLVGHAHHPHNGNHAHHHTCTDEQSSSTGSSGGDGDHDSDAVYFPENTGASLPTKLLASPDLAASLAGLAPAIVAPPREVFSHVAGISSRESSTGAPLYLALRTLRI